MTPVQRSPKSRSVNLAVLIVTIAGLAATLFSAQAAMAKVPINGQGKLCWGATLGPDGGCGTMEDGGPASVYARYKVEVWSPQHSVCAVIGIINQKKCSSGPEKKAVVTGELCSACAAPVSVVNNAQGPSTV